MQCAHDLALTIVVENVVGPAGAFFGKGISPLKSIKMIDKINKCGMLGGTR